MKITHSAEVEVTFDTSAGYLKRLLDDIPDDARIDVRVVQDDRGWGSSAEFISFEWTEEK